MEGIELSAVENAPSQSESPSHQGGAGTQEAPVIVVGGTALDFSDNRDIGLFNKTYMGYPDRGEPPWRKSTPELRDRFIGVLIRAAEMAEAKGDHRNMRCCVDSLGRLTHFNYLVSRGIIPLDPEPVPVPSETPVEDLRMDQRSTMAQLLEDPETREAAKVIVEAMRKREVKP